MGVPTAISPDAIPTQVPKPASVEQCHAVIDALAQQIAALHEQIALLQGHVRLDLKPPPLPVIAAVA